MKNILLFSLLLMFTMIVRQTSAQSIIIVTDDATASQPFADELSAVGYTVEVRTDFNVELSQGQIDELDAADFILITRNTNSANYNFPDAWNFIDTPILLSSCFLTRSTRLAWLNTTEVNEADGVEVSILKDTHPIFEGIDVSSGILAINSTVPLHTNPIEDAGNGTVIAVSSTTGNIVIAEWLMDTDFYQGGGFYAAEYRAVFFTGISYNFTEEGRQLFLNFVNYILTLDEQTTAREELKEELSVYPLPAENYINIKGAVSPDAAFEIFSLSGQVLSASKLTGNKQIDTSDLKAGMYILKLKSNNGLFTCTILKK